MGCNSSTQARKPTVRPGRKPEPKPDPVDPPKPEG